MSELNFRIHADDYAVSKHAAEQVIELIKVGNITSVSYMINMPDSETCLQMLQPYKKHIQIALHLNIFEGHCCADQADIPHLVYPNGTYRLSWGMLLWKMLLPCYRREIKKELMSQIERYYVLMEMDKETPIRIDSHQHFHMIPLVFRCLCELIEDCNYQVEYIRMAKEPVMPFIECISLYSTYRFTNCLKNLICNIFSWRNIKLLKKLKIQTCSFLGLIYSNHMDAHSLYIILKILERKKGSTEEVEITFHPGRMLETEETEVYNHAAFLKWHKSRNRDSEYKECSILSKLLYNKR